VARADVAGGGAPLMPFADVERALLAAAAARAPERPLALLFRRLPAAALSAIAHPGAEEDPAPSLAAGARAASSAEPPAGAGGAGGWASVVPDEASDLRGLAPEDVVAAVRAALGLELGHIPDTQPWVFAVMSPQDARALVRETHSNRLPVAGAGGAAARGVAFAIGPHIQLGPAAASAAAASGV